MSNNNILVTKRPFVSLQDMKRMSVEEKKTLICFAGVGSAFAKRNHHTSLIVVKNGKSLIVDIGTNIPNALHQKGIKLTDFDYYHFTHSHGDHIGGAEELLFAGRYINKQKPKVIITDHYQDILWEKSLKGGMEYSEAGLLKFSDFVEPIRPEWVKVKPREMYEINLDGLNLKLFRTAHIPGFVSGWEAAFWSNGLVIDDQILFSGDSRFDPLLFKDVYDANKHMHIFHDCQLFAPGSVHATIDELDTLSDDIKAKMSLVHYGDTFESHNPENRGFFGFAKAWDIYDFENVLPPDEKLTALVGRLTVPKI